MARQYWQVIYIDRNPDNLDEGWGWVEVAVEDLKRFNIPSAHPAPRMVQKQKEIAITRDKDSVSYSETYINSYSEHLCVPSRGKAGAKRFTLNIQGELIIIKAQKSLTIRAICTWVKTWAAPDTEIITPGNRLVSIDGEKLAQEAYFVYFILNRDSKAIKIGKAQDVERRLRSLQTSSPVELRLLKSILVKNAREAYSLEQSLHQKFKAIRLAGEWFKATPELMDYISQV